MYNWDFTFKKETCLYSTQADWNKTIIHKLNEFVERFNIKGNPIIIESPKKYLEIFDSIVFFNRSTGMLGTKYKIIFHLDNMDNCLRFEEGKKKFLIKNYRKEIYNSKDTYSKNDINRY